MQLKISWTKERLRNHFLYGLWKYALVIALSIFAWDLIYSATAYRPPQDKRVDVYVQSVSAPQELVQAYFDDILATELPDMELVTASMLMGSSQNDIYAAQQLTTYIMAGEGDIYILGSADFKQFASQGVFLRLDQPIAEGKLDVGDLDLSRGYVAMQEYDDKTERMVPISSQQLFGIPTQELHGLLSDLNMDNRDMVMAVTVFSQNEDNVLKFLNELISRSHKPYVPPAGPESTPP